MKTTLLAILLAAGISTDAGAAQSTIIYAPEGSESTEGNSFLLSPLIPNGGPRFQQVFHSSLFTLQLPAGGGWVTDISFRADGPFGGNFIVQVPNLQVSLSTTVRVADGLSIVFDENLGADQTIVLGPGPRELRSSHNINNSTQPFAMGFTLSHPFYYDPAAGNLLMEIRSVSTGPQTFPQVFMDAVDVSGDSISSIGGLPSNPIGAPSTIGLVTFFGFQPVPEPSSLALLAVGLSALA